MEGGDPPFTASPPLALWEPSAPRKLLALSDCRLQSICNLRAYLRSAMHKALRGIAQHWTWDNLTQPGIPKIKSSSWYCKSVDWKAHQGMYIHSRVQHWQNRTAARSMSL